MSDTIVPGGQVDQEPGLVDDGDFGLDGDMRQQLVDALTARWDADDPGATTLPDDPQAPAASPAPAPDQPLPADTAATPAPASDPTPAAPVAGAPEGDGGGGADATAASGAPDPNAPAPAPTDDEFDLNTYARDYFGTSLTREQSAELFGVLAGLQSLSPEQRAWMDQQLASGAAGRYPVTAGQPPQPYPEPAPQPQPQPQPQDPAVAVLGPRPDADDYLAANWDLNARAVRATQSQIDELNANVARQTQADQARQIEAARVAIAEAESSWRTSHPLLTDGEWDGIQRRVVASGQYPAILAANHGDHQRAVAALYDQHFWADPSLRTRAMANAASGRDPMDPGTPDPTTPAGQQQAELEAGRQALAGSVAGGGGNIAAPPGTPPTAPPKDPEKRREAMVQEIASAHEFQ